LKYQPGNKKGNLSLNFIFTKFLFLNDSCYTVGILTTLRAGIWSSIHSRSRDLFTTASTL